jgi:hypothetical protein
MFSTVEQALFYVLNRGASAAAEADFSYYSTMLVPISGHRESTGEIEVVVEDLNGDGAPDLVVASIRSSSISVYRNTGRNASEGPLFEFVAETLTKTARCATARKVRRVADINRDSFFF